MVIGADAGTTLEASIHPILVPPTWYRRSLIDPVDSSLGRNSTQSICKADYYDSRMRLLCLRQSLGSSVFGTCTALLTVTATLPILLHPNWKGSPFCDRMTSSKLEGTSVMARILLIPSSPADAVGTRRTSFVFLKCSTRESSSVCIESTFGVEPIYELSGWRSSSSCTRETPLYWT